MSSYEERFYRESPDLRSRVARNLRLLIWLVGELIAWFWPGRRIRRAYRKAEQDGKEIYLDDAIKLDQE